MSIAYDEILSSPTFAFLVGKERKRMSMHTALVAEHSPALKTLVTGPMEEAQSGSAVWDDVEEATFVRFAQFVYTGDYTPPAHTIDKASAKLLGDPRELEEAEFDRLDQQRFNQQDEEDRAEIQAENEERRARLPPKPVLFLYLQYPPPAPRFENRAYSNTYPEEVFLPVFLGHAKLYVLADKYDIMYLKQLILHKLFTTLSNYRLFKNCFVEIVELARYVYKNTATRSEIDPLRKLVMLYITCQGTQLIGCDACIELTMEDRDFASDLLKMMSERMKHMKG